MVSTLIQMRKIWKQFIISMICSIPLDIPKPTTSLILNQKRQSITWINLSLSLGEFALFEQNWLPNFFFTYCWFLANDAACHLVIHRWRICLIHIKFIPGTIVEVDRKSIQIKNQSATTSSSYNAASWSVGRGRRKERVKKLWRKTSTLIDVT